MGSFSAAPRIANAADRHILQWQASDNNLLAATFDPMLVSTSSANTLGFISVVRMWVPNTITVSNVIVNIAVAGATLTSGQTLAGLYDSSKARFATTASQHTGWTLLGPRTMALTADAGKSLTIQGGPSVWIYAAFLANGTTAPKFSSAPADANATQNIGLADDGGGYRSAFTTAGSRTSLLDPLPALSAWTERVWAALT